MPHMERRHFYYYQSNVWVPDVYSGLPASLNNCSNSFKEPDLKHYLYYNALTVSGSIHQVSRAVNSGAGTCALILQWQSLSRSGKQRLFAIGAPGSWNRTAFEMCTSVMSCYTCKSLCQHKPEFGFIIPSGHILYKCISRPIKKNN